MILPNIAESDFQKALSDADEVRATKLNGNGLSPIEIFAEPITDANPLPITVSITEPVNAGFKDEVKVGDSALYEIVAEDKPFKNAHETSRTEPLITPEETLHSAVESDIHLDDSHEHPEKDKDCVAATMPKLKPTTDKVKEPVLAALNAEGKVNAGGA